MAFEQLSKKQKYQYFEHLGCGRFISADWLARWADSDPELTSIDNSRLLCPHGKLLPNKPAGLHLLTTFAILPVAIFNRRIATLECQRQSAVPTQHTPKAKDCIICLDCSGTTLIPSLILLTRSPMTVI